MRLGIHENYQGPTPTTFARTAAAFPLAQVAREFESGPIGAQDLVKRVVARCQAVWDSGGTAVWSFKPSPVDVFSGLWKPYAQALGKYLAGHGLSSKTVVVIWHEPENDLGKYFATPGAFVKLFDTFHDWLMQADPTIMTSHAALAYAYRDKAMTDATAAQWVTKATIHSVDIYSGRSFPLSMTLDTSSAFKRWKASRPAGARWGVSERGWIADSDQSAQRAASIDAEADWLAGLPANERPEFYIVWNTQGTENDPKIILDPAGADAVNAMFARFSGAQPVQPTQKVCPLCAGTGVVGPGTYTVVRVAAT